MERKRSKGVIIFGVLFVVFCALGLLRYLKPEYLQQAQADKQFILHLLMNVFGLIAGIYILMLKEFGRKLEIGIRIAAILMILINFKPHLDGSRLSAETIEKTKRMIFENPELKKKYEVYTPEHRERLLKQQKEFFEKSAKSLPIVMMFFAILMLFWNSFIIFFFTRPKVKAQFSPPESKEKSL